MLYEVITLVIALVGLRLAGKAGRKDARRASESMRAQAGIIGHRRQAGTSRRMTRLGQRVFDEGDMRFLAFRNVKFLLRDSYNFV